MLFAVVLLAGCCKDKDTNPVQGIKFTGITETETQGIPIGAVDTTDWRADDNWLAVESRLFTNMYTQGCSAPFNFGAVGFPNPCEHLAGVCFDKLPTTKMELRLVDKHFRTLVSLDDSLPGDCVQFNLEGLNINHDTVRLYYKFIDNNCEYRGHGDIAVSY